MIGHIATPYQFFTAHSFARAIVVAMHFKLKHGSRSTNMNHVARGETDCGKFTLAAALRVSLGWWNQVAPASPQQRDIGRMRHFVGGRLIARDWSRESLATVRTMFCLNCRKVHPGLAAYCTGKPLVECVLLK